MIISYRNIYTYSCYCYDSHLHSVGFLLYSAGMREKPRSVAGLLGFCWAKLARSIKCCKTHDYSNFSEVLEMKL